ATRAEGDSDPATNPLNRDTDWSSIQAFCDQLNNDLEGPQLATRLLAHKIQSPQEWEAMQALLVLETCMKNCGKRFHSEVGKFRFLNELIKVVSPKYLGSRSPEPVKNKVLELIYSWTLGLPEEAKISDAYQMLKKQGIIKQDPELPPDKLLNLPPPRPKNAIFEDEEKSKTLSRLLNSSHPEDLKAANNLIKEMVQEDQRRAEKVSKRVNAIQEVKESVALLTQLLQDYDSAASNLSNAELLQDLYQRCEKMRPTLFRLASDTEDNDEALAEILQANDSLTHVINLYKQLVKGEIVNGNNTLNTQKQTGGIEADIPSAPSLLLSPDPPSHSQPLSSGSTPGNSALDELDLLGKTLMQQSLPPEGLQVKWYSTTTVLTLSLLKLQGTASLSSYDCEGRIEQPVKQAKAHGDELLHFSVFRDKQQFKPTLRDLQSKCGANISPNPIPAFSSEHSAPLSSQPSLGSTLLDMTQTHTDSPAADITLTDVFVPLESIKPSSLLPVTVFDKHSLRVLFHFARDSPTSRPDVLVVIISMLSSAPVPVTNINFETTAPKTMAVKLQPPSGTELPAFNPILPPAAVTQILLLANPNKEKVQLQYRLTFTMGEQEHSESGSLEHFPPPDTWGNL
uniref:Golgi-associated, gamma adaptin ear containing, ARF binding protein 1 n=1 Tax=Scophthalmus maximus TaxID=52904 RepID=A0A8D3DA00_SCOMX